MKVLLLCRYGPLGASSRVRMYQFLPALGAAGIEVTPAPLVDDQLLSHRYAVGRHARATLIARYAARLRRLLDRRAFDVMWIEYELFPWLPVFVDLLFVRRAPPVVLEYDDAVFEKYDGHASPIVRAVLGGKHDRLMARAAAVVAGNEYLAQRARAAGAPIVVTLPSVVDTSLFVPAARPAGTPPIVGWIGSPTTARYLHLVEPVLAALTSAAAGRVTLVGVEPGAQRWSFACEERRWRPEHEVADVQGFDVGIMPLPDDPWTRGKCGYKLVQYMACGIPVVASPVGANRAIVRDHIEGFLPDGDAAWTASLGTLLADPARRAEMGAAGRARAVDAYAVHVVAPRLVEVLSAAAGAAARA